MPLEQVEYVMAGVLDTFQLADATTLDIVHDQFGRRGYDPWAPTETSRSMCGWWPPRTGISMRRSGRETFGLTYSRESEA